MFKVGDKVRIKDIWKDDIEKPFDTIYTIEEWIKDGNRGFIRADIQIGGWIKPTELVRSEMIELVA